MKDFPYISNLVLKNKELLKKKHYPYNLSVVKHLNKIKFKSPVTFIIGENGSGKSTLLETLALGLNLNSEGGNQNTLFSTYDTHSDLYKDIRIAKGIISPKQKYFLRAETFYNVASQIEKYKDPAISGSYGEKSLHKQSHGESFFSLFMNKFTGEGLYLLDEPEAAMSPSRQMSLISRINDLVIKKSQFIIATHSPILMSFPNSTIYLIEKNEVKSIDYEETEHYQITKTYLNHYPKLLKELLAV